MKKTKKFKVTEKDAANSPVNDIQWEGEEIGVESDTKLEQDTGTGQTILIRFFDFAANQEAFRNHLPTEQELFDSHRKGIESLLWTDGLTPYLAIEPRVLFAKDKSQYRLVVSCIPSLGNSVLENTQTLTQLLANK